MTNTPMQQPHRKADPVTEADAKSLDGESGRSNSKSRKSGKDAASHTKLSTGKGAGGGKKQQRHH